MGVTLNAIKFLRFAERSGVNFERTLMLGRQQMMFPNSGYAEELFKSLGAKTVDSMDAWGGEGATIVHDLNNPVPERLCKGYTCVFDGGTIEHIYDEVQAFQNAFGMVANNGHFLCEHVANNLMGHGLRTFSPEMMWLRLNNHGFDGLVYVREESILGKPTWFKFVPNQRLPLVPVQSKRPLVINVIARKTVEGHPFINQQCCDWSSTPNSKARAIGYALYKRLPMLALILEKAYWAVQTGGKLTTNRNYARVDV